MKRFQNILLADQCTTAAPVPATAHEAAALAQANNAKLTLHSVVPNPPRAQHMLRLGAHMEAVSGLLAAERTARLISLAETLDIADIGVDVAVGSPPHEIVRRVIHAGHDLVIILTDGSEASAATARLDSVGSTQ